MRKNGFTLIEILVSAAILIVLSMSALAVLSRSLTGSARVETERLLDENGKAVGASLTKFIRGVEVVTVGANDRDSCLAAGNDGVTGEVMTVKAIDGLTTTINLNPNFVASNEASLHSSSITANNLVITWKCSQGLSDVIEMSFVLAPVLGEETDSALSSGKSYSFTTTLRNTVD
jgi:type II secretory pathway pseudopilin PulG